MRRAVATLSLLLALVCARGAEAAIPAIPTITNTPAATRLPVAGDNIDLIGYNVGFRAIRLDSVTRANHFQIL